MNPLDTIEAAAVRSAVSVTGGRSEHVGGALCMAHPLLPIPELNRVFPLGGEIDLDAIGGWFAGSEHIVAVSPENASLAPALAEHGYRPARAWMKFERGADLGPSALTNVAVAETTDQDIFALVLGEGSAIAPEPAAAQAPILETSGWRYFVAWLDGEPAGGGALFLDGDAAWCGIAATRPQFRRRGAQSALLAARIAAARSDGATVITTETGEQLPGRSNSSYNNILRAGFREAYLRPNWQSPG